MKMVACMIRRLNEDVDYATFRKSWIPDENLEDDPRRVLSAVNLDDPRELITLAIIEDGDPADIPGWMEKIAPIEQRRHERIKHLVSAPTVNAIYEVVAEDDLSQPISS
ncbi:MAG TPA: hypothetical protein VGH27_16780 [Streptosporangiaceae bacterium]|jgi:hypothetical protein